MKGEESSIGSAESDGGDVVAVERINNQLHCFDGIVRHAEGAGKDIGRPAGQHSQCCLGGGKAGGHFVQGAVAAIGDHDVNASPGRIFGKTGGMATPVGLHDLHIVVLRQALMHRNGVFRRHRGRKGVHNQEDAQGFLRYQRLVGWVTTNVTPKGQFLGVSGWVNGFPVGNNVSYECDRLCQADPRPRSAWCA